MTCRGGKNPARISIHRSLVRCSSCWIFVGFQTLCLEVDNINIYLDANQGWFGKSVGGNTHTLAFTRKIGNRSGSEEPHREKTGFLPKRGNRGTREADQRLCYRYTDSTIPLLLKSEISSF